MGVRLIERVVVADGRVMARVVYHPDLDEYVVIVTADGHGVASYYTEDRGDALATAREMARHAEGNLR